MRHHALTTVLIALLFGGCGETVAPFDGVFDFEVRFEVDTVVRRALVHVPPDYDRSTAVPLVLAFHGAGSSAEEMQAVTHFDEAPDRLGFVAVYPNGAPTGSRKAWMTGASSAI